MAITDLTQSGLAAGRAAGGGAGNLATGVVMGAAGIGMGLHKIIKTRKDKNEADEVQAALQKNLDALDNEVAMGTLQLQEKLAAHAAGDTSVDLEALNIQALKFQMQKFDVADKAMTLIAQTAMAYPENQVLHERLKPLASLHAAKLENVTKQNEALEKFVARAFETDDREDKQEHDVELEGQRFDHNKEVAEFEQTRADTRVDKSDDRADARFNVETDLRKQELEIRKNAATAEDETPKSADEWKAAVWEGAKQTVIDSKVPFASHDEFLKMVDKQAQADWGRVVPAEFRGGQTPPGQPAPSRPLPDSEDDYDDEAYDAAITQKRGELAKNEQHTSRLKKIREDYSPHIPVMEGPPADNPDYDEELFTKSREEYDRSVQATKKLMEEIRELERRKRKKGDRAALQGL